MIYSPIAHSLNSKKIKIMSTYSVAFSVRSRRQNPSIQLDFLIQKNNLKKQLQQTYSVFDFKSIPQTLNYRLESYYAHR